MTPDLAARLRKELRGAVSDDRRHRAEFSSDAGNYRIIPQVVVAPLDIDDVVATLAVSRETGVPITSRGGGTSVAGNAVGSGIVIDFARHLHRILEIDTSGRTALVEPGVILSDLQRQLAPHGLRFGPDPSSQARATLGGMIGNNACGPHALAYGRTSENVEALTVIDGRGRLIRAGPTTETAGQEVAELDALVDAHLQVIRTELGRFPRQVSGYSLEHLLPERGRNLAKALVGTEGTLATTIGATLRLVAISPARMLVVLGYRDMIAAADAVPALLTHRPQAIEGMDARLIDVVRHHQGPSSVPGLPRGGGWLLVEMGGETASEAKASAQSLIRDSEAVDSMIFEPGPAANAMWSIREDGAGLAGRTAGGRPAWPGWEDAAVPPANLGAYLREFESLMDSYGVTGLPYGHFGDGCVHVRIDLPLEDHPEVFRQFIFDAAHLVVRHGGSCSGEHGDGRARSELLPIMYSPAVIELFAAVKALFDPEDLLNPGILVRPRPLDADLRRPQARSLLAKDGFNFAADDGDFTKAVHRCVGIGKCRADNSAAGGFMCPSYLATRDEKDVTRGRARVLQELTNGELIPDLAGREVRESLDLCLSCKACASDCPAGVDMAKYKSEVLHRKYQRRLRPISHYSLGWLPRWISAIDRLPRVGVRIINGTLAFRPFAQILLRAGGIDPRRQVPFFAPVGFRRSWRRVQRTGNEQSDSGNNNGTVVLWADSFTDGMSPEAAHAAAAVLADAGYQVVVPDRRACCGLTWITTGQLTAARKRLLRLLDVLGPYAAKGIPIVGLEPSCVGVLRSDLEDLLGKDPRAAAVSAATRTLAELLTQTPQWRVPDLSGDEIVVQPHCHQHAVMGFGPDQQLLEQMGAAVTTIAGCCGLAGNFGMETGHYDLSVLVAENGLLPALRARDRAALVLADGFSCRTQAEQLGGVRAIHLAQLLAQHIPDRPVRRHD